MLPTRPVAVQVPTEAPRVPATIWKGVVFAVALGGVVVTALYHFTLFILSFFD
jgi:hypothetical protein